MCIDKNATPALDLILPATLLFQKRGKKKKINKRTEPEKKYSKKIKCKQFKKGNKKQMNAPQAGRQAGA